MATEQTQQTILEINGRPFYVKSDEKGNPHLYDIDTNEEVGYWCQKSGTYVMFSPYEQIMNRLKRLNEEDLKNNVKEKETEGTEGTEETQEEEDDDDDDNSVDDDDSSVEDEDDETKKIENLWSNTVFVKFIILMLIYNMFQKMVQSIYVDFAFAFAFTILYIKMVKTVASSEL
jgi:hypothetical protein